MNNSSDDQQNKFSRIVSLSRSVVLNEKSRIPSLLLLGKLAATDGAPDMASLREELLNSWDPSGDVKFWRVTDGAFLIQFYDREDLTRVLDGAPWSCGGSNLFLVRHVDPDTNLFDQVVGAGSFDTAELWVQFHNVPVEYVSTASVYKLAECIGQPVGNVDLGAAAVDQVVGCCLRARVEVNITKPLVRSLPVNLDGQGCSRREMVSVVYEQIPSLCASCGIIGHPTDRCPKGGNKPGPAAAAPGLAASSSFRERLAAGSVWARLGSRSSSSREAQPTPTATTEMVDDQLAGASSKAFLPPEAPAVALSRSLRDKSTGYVWSRLGSRSSSSREAQPLRSVEQEDHYGRSFGRSSSSAQLLPKTESSAATHNLLGQETPRPQIVSANRCLPCNNFLKLSSFRKKTAVVGGKEALNSEVDLQASQKNQTQHAASQTVSRQPSVKESLVGAEESPSDTSLAPRRSSSIQIGGGYVKYYPYLGSRKNRKIEVIVETQCSPQIMKKAMEWLCENTGLKASYDGSRGVICIVGIQVDQRMGPLDLVAYLYPEARPKTGATYVQKKPDSPARFEDMLLRFHDENCCKARGASTSKDTKRNTV